MVLVFLVATHHPALKNQSIATNGLIIISYFGFKTEYLVPNLLNDILFMVELGSLFCQ